MQPSERCLPPPGASRDSAETGHCRRCAGGGRPNAREGGSVDALAFPQMHIRLYWELKNIQALRARLREPKERRGVGERGCVPIHVGVAVRACVRV